MILVVYGTRPEAIKLAPCVTEARALGLPVHVHCTMQSPDLVDRGVLGWDTAGHIDHLTSTWHDVAITSKAAMVVVQGDTRTAFHAAVMGYEHNAHVFHLEAGVRTYDLSAPWPEEGYRQMISRIARWHACTTRRNRANLVAESRRPGHHPDDHHDHAVEQHWLRVTGSPIVESVLGRLPSDLSGRTLSEHIVVTMHRRENRGHFADILRGILDTVPAHEVRWFSHPNSWAATEGMGLPVTPLPTEPPSTFPLHAASARLVVTDSGGVQEECNALGVPCVVARTVTDRPESLVVGGAILGGHTRESVATAIREALALDRTAIDTTIFGDGTASKHIARWWQEILA